MRSNYKKLGSYIQQVKKRNADNFLTVENLRGININKEFMPSVANVTGTDLSKYKVVEKNQFAYNPMHVGRDGVLPISMLELQQKVIVSPAYVIFEVVDKQILLPEYLMMWFRRSEFDRNAWFTTDSSVRGGFNWDDFCELELPIPSIEKQREIVAEYYAITNRIKLNEQLNQKLEETAQTIYKEWFVDFEFPHNFSHSELDSESDIRPYKSGGGEMVYCEDLEKEIPEGWGVVTLKDLCTLQNGYAFKASDFSDNGSIPIIKIKNITPPIIDLNDSQCFSNSINEKLTKYTVKYDDILISMTGSGVNQLNSAVGQVGRYVAKNMSLLNQRVGKLIINNKKHKLYAYFFLSHKDTQMNLLYSATGSANQANISPEQIINLDILRSKDDVLLNFENVCRKIINLNDIKRIENKKLLDLTEILLSKMATVEG
ncbi:restriction endonuclease subunit S [Francisella sciaenopsi]|uniref:Type I restriction modification DNA specificity domain-containing protein n=1 Tax=Francisella sciaenopsi TaxID=3055034 RepID=A0ABQ6PDQ1_9GAMM